MMFIQSTSCNGLDKYTSNARRRTRSALSRRNRVSEVSETYLGKRLPNTDLEFGFSDSGYPSVNPYKKFFFS